MICERCGCFFCPLNLEGPVQNSAPQRYCSKACAYRAAAKRSGYRNRSYNKRRKAKRLQKRCTGKVRYPDGNIALLGLLRHQLEYGSSGREGVYECPDCGGWHVTTHLRHQRLAGA